MIFRLLLCAVVFAGFSSPAVIQSGLETLELMDVDELLSQLTESEFIIGGIVVTVTRRESNLPDTPVSNAVIRKQEFRFS